MRIFYVSIHGDDSSAGTLEKPFRTIQRAAYILEPGDRCIIREGVYRETVVPACSGSEDSPICYEAYPGERVVISGSEEIRPSWKHWKNSIYVADAAMLLQGENQVFFDGEMMLEARWPKAEAGVMSPGLSTAGLGSTETSIVDVRLPDKELRGAGIWIFSAWFAWTSEITGSSAGRLYFDDHAPDHWTKSGPGCRYYLFGSRELLTCEKEWYYDQESGKLYFYAPGGLDPASGTVEVKTRRNAFILDNRSWIHLKNLSIFAASITGTDTHHCILEGLTVRHVSHNSLNADRYESQQDTGIFIQGDGNTVRSCEISFSSGNGLVLNGRGNLIFNNCIHDINYSGTFCSGIGVGGSSCYIGYNTVYNTGRSAIGINAPGSVVERNDFSRSGMLSEDCGTLHIGKSDGGNTEIRYNRFHDSRCWYLGVGIYLDNSTSNFHVHHNVVWNHTEGIRLNHPSNFNIVEHNHVDGSLFSNWGWVFMNDTYGDRINGNVFTRGWSVTGGTDMSGNSMKGFEADLYGPAGHDFNAMPVPGFDLRLHPLRNRIQNSGFEFGSLDPWRVTGKGQADIQPAIGDPINQDKGLTRTGYGSVRLTGVSTGLEQRVDGLETGKYYEFSVWLKIDRGERARMGVRLPDGVEHSETVEVTGESWTQRIVQFKAGHAETGAVVYLQKDSAGDGCVYGDDFGLIPQSDTLLDGSRRTIELLERGGFLYNSGFESGNFSGWMSTGAEVVREHAFKGEYSARLTARGSRMLQLVTALHEGVPFTLSAWVRACKGGRARLGIRNYGGEEKYIKIEAPEYKRYRIEFIPSDGCNGVEVYLSKESEAGIIFADEFSVIETDKGD